MTGTGSSSTATRVRAGLESVSAPVWHHAAPAEGTSRAAEAARWLLRVCLVIAIVGAVVQGVLHLIDVLALDGRYDMINADVDTGAFTWAGSVATFGAAVGSALLAALVPARRALLVVTTLVITFFSLDDMTALHERITVSHIGPVEHAGRILWVVVSMPVLAAAFLALLAVATRAPGPVQRLLVAGLLLLVAAIVLEITSPVWFALGSGHGGVLYESEVVLEEGAELAGWLLITGALAAGALLVAGGGDDDRREVEVVTVAATGRR